MIEFLRSLDLLREIADFLHLSMAGVFYFTLAATAFIWLYNRQSRLFKFHHNTDKAIFAMKTKKDLNKTAYHEQERRMSEVLKHNQEINDRTVRMSEDAAMVRLLLQKNNIERKL